MASLTYRPGSKQDPSYAHDDGTHTVFVMDIMQRGTAAQVYQALTDPAQLTAWTGAQAEATAEGARWKIPAVGLVAESAGEVVGAQLAVALTVEGWPTPRTRAQIKLWPTPRATLVVVSHGGLTEDDIDPARALWAPEVLDRLRRYISVNGPQRSPVGVLERS